ncbi:MAG: hypothetical protein ABW047_05885, partial [Nitrospiraceae bacterium]
MMIKNWLVRGMPVLAVGLIGIILSIGVQAVTGPQDGELPLPSDYKSWPKFLSKSNVDAKQVCELYANPPLGAKKGCPVSAFNGTLMVMELYKAKAEGGG